MAYPLIIIVNQSLCTGKFPHRIKYAKVIPLYKKDDNKLVGNYRPISLLSSLAKIFEKIVLDQLYDYMITNGLLFESQYGFRKEHSTELAALELTDRIRREMDQDKIPCSVLLDLSKAFDTLNHHTLLSKLFKGLKASLYNALIGIWHSDSNLLSIKRYVHQPENWNQVFHRGQSWNPCRFLYIYIYKYIYDRYTYFQWYIEFYFICW